MKISLQWIFDHIVGDAHSVDMPDLANRFIKTTAEIEGWRKSTLDLAGLTLAEIISIDKDFVLLYSTETGQQYRMQVRSGVRVGSWYLLAVGGDTNRWATTVTLGGIKEMLLPSLTMPEVLRSGGWKKSIETEDYIIDIDNKSINHRPDLWGHRGIAREIAAILDMSLISLETMVLKKKRKSYEFSVAAHKELPYAVSIEKTSGCDRFAGLYISSVQSQSSVLSMVVRLSRLDNRSIDFLVDSTNYVMLDLGQPMHAFDAETISGGLAVRKAYQKEKIALLDGEIVNLTDEDVVIVDTNGPVSLAGIMGGSITGITAQTSSVLLEAAHFDPTIIRKTSARYKKRTESSMRFEKNLDPMGNCDAIERFLFLLNAHSVTYQTSDEIISLGATPEQLSIYVLHSFIESRLGITLTAERVVEILQKLFFTVEENNTELGLRYTVAVPSWRATKDMGIAEDVVEEVGRFIGYDSIPQVLPSIQSSPADLQQLYRLREIKHLLSYGFSMRELCGYAFFEELFLKHISWDPGECVSVKNPVSEIHSRLVTTLQPQMLKAIAENGANHRQLRFYEWGRIWHEQNGEIQEKRVLTGIIYDQDGAFDFYEGKSFLTRLFTMLALHSVEWRHGANRTDTFTWLVEHKTAMLMHNNHVVGVCGVVDGRVLSSITSNGSAFMFELDGDYLLGFSSEKCKFMPLPKYPSVRRDVSMLIPVSITIDTLTDSIKKVDLRIESVILIDFFEKKEWKDQKSVAFHVEMRDNNKTLEHDEVELLWEGVIATLVQQGAIIR